MGMPCRTRSFRGREIGTALLNRVIFEAGQAGVSYLWGSVTASDIAGTPHLLDWYAKMGFEVRHRTSDPVVKAAATISMRLNAALCSAYPSETTRPYDKTPFHQERQVTTI